MSTHVQQTIVVHIPKEKNLGYTAMQAYLKDIAKAAGGYTVHEALGGWVMADGSLCHEPNLVLTIHAFTAAAIIALEPILRDLIRDMLTVGNQEAVLADIGSGVTIYTLEDF